MISPHMRTGSTVSDARRRPAHTAADSQNLHSLPAFWLDAAAKAGCPDLYHGQAVLLTELGKGKDFIGESATGSGKSHCWLLPAAASALARIQGPAPTEVGPVVVVCVPTAALAAAHEEAADNFL